MKETDHGNTLGAHTAILLLSPYYLKSNNPRAMKSSDFFGLIYAAQNNLNRGFRGFDSLFNFKSRPVTTAHINPNEWSQRSDSVIGPNEFKNLKMAFRSLAASAQNSSPYVYHYLNIVTLSQILAGKELNILPVKKLSDCAANLGINYEFLGLMK